MIYYFKMLLFDFYFSMTQKFCCMLMSEPTGDKLQVKRFMVECPLTVMIKALIY